MVDTPRILLYPEPVTPKDRLVFALDVEQADEAERLIRELAPHVGMFKVGPRLFTGVGPEILDRITQAGGQVFVDLKLHDIPETVAASVHEIVRHRTRMFTVHALGGGEMIRRVVSELSHATLIPGVPFPQCIAVTVLTSHGEAGFAELGFSRGIAAQVEHLARLAIDNGAAGVVASGHELAALRAALPPRTVFVVPGIRSAADPVQDQARVMSPAEAIRAGATYLVVGRPIRLAKEPRAAAQRLVEEIAGALGS